VSDITLKNFDTMNLFSLTLNHRKKNKTENIQLSTLQLIDDREQIVLFSGNTKGKNHILAIKTGIDKSIK
jgi:hypothetical protein